MCWKPMLSPQCFRLLPDVGAFLCVSIYLDRHRPFVTLAVWKIEECLRTLPQVIERHDEIRLKLLAIAVLRNTSASKRSLVRSSGMLVQFLVKQLDHASRKDIWSAGTALHLFYVRSDSLPH